MNVRWILVDAENRPHRNDRSNYLKKSHEAASGRHRDPSLSGIRKESHEADALPSGSEKQP